MTGLDTLSRDELQRLQGELGGEKILWAGRPSWRRAAIGLLGLWLFAVPWTAFALGWESMVLAPWLADIEHRPTGSNAVMAVVMPIFGLPFVLIGLGMMAAPIVAAMKASRTVHVLTDRRLVTAVLGRTLTIQSIDPGAIMSLTRTERPDGTGSMKISFGTYRDSDGDAVDKSETWAGVAGVRDLEVRLREVMAGARTTWMPENRRRAISAPLAG